jgi:ethanolamine ammonia-lyase large subunit
VLGLAPAPEFEAWMDRMDLLDERRRVRELAPGGAQLAKFVGALELT